MDKTEKVKKLVQKIAAKHREKKKETVGDVHIDNIDKPKHLTPKKNKKDKEHKKEGDNHPKKMRLVGPKGGVFEVTEGGKRKYDSKKANVKKSLEAHVEFLEVVEKVVEKVKKSRE